MGHDDEGEEETEKIVLWVLFGLTVLLFIAAFSACVCCYIYKKTMTWIAYIGAFVTGAIMLYQLTLALGAQLETFSSSST